MLSSVAVPIGWHAILSVKPLHESMRRVDHRTKTKEKKNISENLKMSNELNEACEWCRPLYLVIVHNLLQT